MSSSRNPEIAIHLTLISPDPNLTAQLETLFRQDQHFAFETVQGSIGDITGELSNANLKSDLLIVEINAENPDELTSLKHLMTAGDLRVPVIVIAETLHINTTREFLRLGVADWIPKTQCDQHIIAACEQTVKHASAIRQDSGAVCYTFLPTKGGVGNTTLAIETAFTLARKKRRFKSTCLVDMDFQCGTIAEYLNVSPNLQLGEIAHSPGRLDDQLLEVMLSQHESGLAVLAEPNSRTVTREVSGELVTELLNLVSLKYDYVVIDLPGHWLTWTEDVILGSNKVFIVTDMTVPGFRHAKTLLNDISGKYGSDVDSSVIINKYRRRLIGSGLKKKDATDLFGENLAGFVSDKRGLAEEAIDRGVPLHAISKINRINKDLEKILFGLRKK